jgi:hypothetical protein
MTRRAIIVEAIWVALIGSCVIPLWIVERPAIQDLPQHLAAIRVLHSYGDATFGLQPYFTVELFRTQYIAYYALADLLAYPLGVDLANRVLLTLSLAATPFAMRALLRQLGSNQELATLTLPLVYNAHLVLGFLNFLAAIPLCLFGLVLALRDRERPRRATAASLALLLVVTFYMHVIPFALLALGVGLIHLRRDLRALWRGLLPLGPALLAAIAWLIWSPAGQATAGAARGDRGQTLGPVFRPIEQAWATVAMWMTDVLRSDVDDSAHVYVTWLVLAALLFGLGLAWTSALPRVRVAYRLMLLPLTCAAAYFALPESYDWIWPIAPRFPLLGLLLLIAVVPRLPIWIARGVALAALVLAFSHTKAVAEAFVAFDRDEVGELDAALDTIPKAQRVAGLIFDRGSRHVKFSPFIHAVAYYQADKGGAVMFTFADFPQSPFRFRNDHRPPPVGPRWEWMPERVLPSRDLAWYDYVLVRGGPGRIAREATRYQPVFRGPHWSVWRRQ